jgi:hypothetical protein
MKKFSAKVTEYIPKEKLVGKQVLAVVNFPSKQIGPKWSSSSNIHFKTDLLY